MRPVKEILRRIARNELVTQLQDLSKCHTPHASSLFLLFYPPSPVCSPAVVPLLSPPAHLLHISGHHKFAQPGDRISLQGGPQGGEPAVEG